jgi:hypothetical protein
MRNQELEGRKNQIVTEMQRLLVDLEKLGGETPVEKVEGSNESILDFYIPKGLRNIHKVPRLRLW